MPTKAIPAQVLGKQSAKQAEVIAVAVGSAIVAALKPSLDALAADKTDRHGVAQIAQTAIDKAHNANELAKVNESKIEELGKRMYALMGDGLGENGKLAMMDKNINDVKGEVRDVKHEIGTMSVQMTELLANSKQSQNFMSGFGGAKTGLGILATLLAALGALIAILVRMK